MLLKYRYYFEECHFRFMKNRIKTLRLLSTPSQNSRSVRPAAFHLFARPMKLSQGNLINNCRINISDYNPGIYEYTVRVIRHIPSDIGWASLSPLACLTRRLSTQCQRRQSLSHCNRVAEWSPNCPIYLRVRRQLSRRNCRRCVE